MKKTDILTRIKYSVEEEYSENVTNKVITSSQLGVVSSFTWEGYRCKEGKPEYIKQVKQNLLKICKNQKKKNDSFFLGRSLSTATQRTNCKHRKKSICTGIVSYSWSKYRCNLE